ncbi:MAG: SDR family NAD(P)-dependent oxidoreductase [Streptosporangiales bacterium]|nr:SDR family NAD(P)-dependent oxidoreductase [Streptosporangiales bacterium]
MSGAHGESGVEMLRLDVRSEESVAACVSAVLDRAGHIDVLVNNAGVMHQGFAEETGPDQASAVFATNLFGVARVTNPVLPGMRSRRRGRIINVGSLAAWVGEPGEAYYAASKAALARYTEALRHEVWPLGISVSLVEPGAFTTGVIQASPVAEPVFADYDGAREAARRTLQESLRRGDDPRTAPRSSPPGTSRDPALVSAGRCGHTAWWRVRRRAPNQTGGRGWNRSSSAVCTTKSSVPA